MAWSAGKPFPQCGFSNGTVNMDDLKLTELQMHSIIIVISSFLTKEDLYFSSSTYNLILQEKKIYQSVQKGCLISISKILEI